MPERRLGEVAKWSKAAVCKTAIHGFESRPRLLVAGGVIERIDPPGWWNGLHGGLKIPCPAGDMWVRLPPPA